MLEVGSVGITGTQAQVAAATNVQTFHFQTVIDQNGSTAGFHDTLVLPMTTTLDFFIVDGFLTDNLGGVALDLEPVSQPPQVPLPAALPLFATGLGALGLLGWRGRRQRRT